MPRPIASPSATAGAMPEPAQLSAERLLLPLLDEALLRCNPHLDRPAEVHALRVAMSRLRVGLALLDDAAGLRGRRQLDRRLRRLRHQLAPLREWDVLRAVLGHATVTPQSRRLCTAAAERRRRALHQVGAVLADRRAEKLREQLYELRHRLTGAPPSRRPAVPIDRAFARTALDRRLDKVRARAARLSSGAAEDMHRLRLQIKKLRYSAELLASLYPGPGAAAFLLVLKALQDELGAAHDAIVQAAQLASLRARVDGAEPAPRQDLQTAEALLVLGRHCTRQLRALQPFWHAPVPSATPRRQVRKATARASRAAPAPTVAKPAADRLGAWAAGTAQAPGH